MNVRTLFRCLSLLIATQAGEAVEAVAGITGVEEICSADAPRCTLTRRIEVGGPDDPKVVLDFGPREFAIVDGGRIDIQDRFVTIRASNFVADIGNSDAILAKGGGDGPTEGGDMVIEVLPRCSGDTSRTCLDDEQCGFGACSASTCAAADHVRCEVDADCSLGQCLRACSNDPSAACEEDRDCSFGPCNLAQRRCVGNPDRVCVNNQQCELGSCAAAASFCAGDPSVACSSDDQCRAGPCSIDVCELTADGEQRRCDGDADCSDGTCSIEAGGVMLNGKFRGNAADPASLTIRSSGSVVVSQSIQVDALSPDGDGGTIWIESNDGDVVIAGPIKSSGGSQSEGGEVSLIAARDVLLEASITADGGFSDGGAVEVRAGRDIVVTGRVDVDSRSGGGYGGSVCLDAGRDVTLARGSELVASGSVERGSVLPGDGGAIEITAGGDISTEPGVLIRAAGEAPDGTGGEISFSAEGDILLAGPVRANGLGERSWGGCIETEAMGTLTVASTGVLTATGGVEAPDGLIILASERDMSLAGTIDTRATGSLAYGGTEGANIDIVSNGNIDVSGSLNGGAGSFMQYQGCAIEFAGTARMNSADGLFVIAAREALRIESGAKLTSTGDEAEIRIRYRPDGLAPVIETAPVPEPDIAADPELTPCSVCGDGVIEGDENCDDGNADSGDGCSAQCLDEGCIAGTPGFPEVALCDDGDACTVDACDTAASQCSHVEDCNDGLDCTVDFCSEAERVCENRPSAILCDDFNPCTIDFCGFIGCGNQAVADDPPVVCDDGLACTSNDRCIAGQCGGTDECGAGDLCSQRTGECVTSTTTTTLPPSTCGDGVVERPEDCDDGDTLWAAGRHCSADCRRIGCGDPDDSGTSTASDALFVLRAAVGVLMCDACVCDVNAGGGGSTVSAGDALKLLQFVVGTPGIELQCPDTCD